MVSGVVSPRLEALHCTQAVLMHALIPNVNDMGEEFFLLGMKGLI